MSIRPETLEVIGWAAASWALVSVLAYIAYSIAVFIGAA